MPGLQRVRKGVLERLVGRLRFPYLFMATGILFLVDLAVPDALPFVDEIFLILLTTLLGSFKNRRRADPEGGDGQTPPEAPAKG